MVKLVKFFDFSHIHRRFGIQNSRASLQLSVNAIVILILAITLLGLGLAFIRNLFGGSVSRLAKIEEQLGEEERKTLLLSQDEVTFLTSNLRIKGREEKVNFAIRNVRSTDLTYEILEGFRCFDAIGAEARQALEDQGLDTDDPMSRSELIQFETYEKRRVDAGKADIVPVRISVKPSAPSSIYSCELKLYILEEIEKSVSGPIVTTRDPDDLGCDDPNSGSSDCKELYATKLFEIEYTKG